MGLLNERYDYFLGNSSSETGEVHAAQIILCDSAPRCLVHLIQHTRAVQNGAKQAALHWAHPECCRAPGLSSASLLRGPAHASAIIYQILPLHYCTADAGNATLFAPSPDMTYGWLGTDCATKLAYVCEVPADSFPCPPPSPPGPPPPLPPSPPFPPFPPNCECAQLSGTKERHLLACLIGLVSGLWKLLSS
jgi:hypothetical protein